MVKTSGGIESKLVEETEKRLCLQDAQTIGSRLVSTVLNIVPNILSYIHIYVYFDTSSHY